MLNWTEPEGHVRVEPPFVDFSNVCVGGVYKATVTATNIGKGRKKIIIEKPARKKLFKFTAVGKTVTVAPGQSVSGLLQFTPNKEEVVRDCLLIHIDDAENIEVPLLAYPRNCCLLTDSVLDFGCVAASRQIISKHHPVTNQGSEPGVFQVQYSADPSISLSPLTGVIEAHETQWLNVELRTDRPGQFDEKALIKLQGFSPVTLTIRAEVVDQRLEVCDLKGDSLPCLRFGPQYYGTSCVKNVLLRNDGPQACDWICLIQDNAAGTDVGTDLRKSTDTSLCEGEEQCLRAAQDFSQVLVCAPDQGRLGPYGTTTVAVSFSPFRIRPTRVEQNRTVRRQDYCLFLLFDSVGRRHGFTHHSGSVELAVTGSGLPVSLVSSPSQRFDFPPAMMGQNVALLCVLQNLCPELPLNFHFRKLSHFITEPYKGTIGPGQSQDVVLSFTARQQGSFQLCQMLDVIGHVHQSSENTAEFKHGSFHTVALQLSAICCSVTGHQPHPDIIPAVTKTTCSPPRVQPRDLAGCHKDPKYVFTEMEQRLRNQKIYTDVVIEFMQARLSRTKKRAARQQDKMLQEVDIGMLPAQGLVPTKLHIRDLEISDISNTKLKSSCAFPLTKCSCPVKKTSIPLQFKNQASEVMNAVPSNSQEVADCSRTLTAQEFYQVVIGPLFLDFGEVCVQSMCVQKLEMTNHLSAYVWVEVEMDCPELQGSSPLSHVLAPCSHSALPLKFQCNKLGPFYRTVTYSVNQQHPGQILVQAQVVPLALELSTNLLVLRSTPPLLVQSGYRSSVTLRNHRNHAAEFTWRPVVRENGVLFSIRPATGTVEPYKELDCDVMWHPSFSSPAEGDFDLCVHEGNTQRLYCVAKVESTSVQLAETQVMFGSVPLNITSIRTAILHNSGQSHAYYQVIDVCPLPGLVVGPYEGVVPSRGKAELKIHFSPDAVIRFDTRVEIALRGMKSIELRVGGSVEPPNLDISVSLFQFHGVHAGSRRAIPFTVTNCSSAAARVTFNLSIYADFSLQLPQSSHREKEPGVSVVEVHGYQTKDCSLVFSPTQAASYDFDLPVMVNGVKWPIGPLSPFPTPSSASTFSSMSAVSWKHMVQPHSRSVTMATRRSPCIQATVLCAPLEMSPASLQLHVEPWASQCNVHTKTVELKAVSEESVIWCGVTSKQLHWWFDCRAIAAPTEDRRKCALCTLTPSSGRLGPSQSVCVEVSIRPEAIRTASDRLIKLSLPLYLGDKDGERKEEERERQPYRELAITITVQRPSITFHPPQILLCPAPLESNATAKLTLVAVGYPSGTRISAEVDEMELENGTKMQHVNVMFPEGNCLLVQKQDQNHPIGFGMQESNVTCLICSVSCSSAVPLSLGTNITFTEQHFNNRFKVKLSAIADNCVLTIWPYMALHRSEQQIVVKTGAKSEEAILQHYQTPSPVSGLASSSSTFDHNSSTNKSSRLDYLPGSDSVSGRSSRDEEVAPKRQTLDNPGVPQFPNANSDEGLYHQNVLVAVERWFSLFGWPNGTHPISVPHSLRRVVSQTQTKSSSGRTYRVSQNKDSRSVMDMFHHLNGKKIPGIHHSETFSTDKDQRTIQLLKHLEALLAFLRMQGASLWHIRPEYLLDVEDFKHWCSQQSNEEEHGLDFRRVDYESLSKRSWMDVLLQIYKVFVLCRVAESGLNTILNQEDVDGIQTANSQPVSSNVYSPCELQLLSWLNKHFQNMRKTVWGTGDVPSARWIVNFDLDLKDGLVFAALLAAYCPYLIFSHFKRMYTTPSSLEQILHNNIILVQSLTVLSLNIDIQATDISDPNPVQMLMLCVHLYERLPQYLPLNTITLSGNLHSTFSKQVRLKSPCSKPASYQALILGEDAHLFSLPDGSTVSILPKTSAELTVQYRCSFLQPTEAVLLLISTSTFGLRATTLAFNLKSHVRHITATKTVRCVSPCYEPKVVQLLITNPFNKDAKFRVVLVESTFNPLEPEKEKESFIQQASSTAQIEQTAPDMSGGEDVEEHPSAFNPDGGSSDFLSAVGSVCLKSGQTHTLDIHYLPLLPGTKYGSVLLVSPRIGDMVYIVKATAELPLPSPLTARPSSNIVFTTSHSVLRLLCKVEQVCEEMVRVPLINVPWERALAIWGQQSMSSEEQRRRLLTHTLYSSTVRASTAIRKLSNQQLHTQTLFGKQAQLLSGTDQCKAVTYSVEVSLPKYFTLPSTVQIPIKEDTNVPWEDPADCGYVDIPLRFQADRVGQFTCQVVLKTSRDIRVYMLEALVTSKGESNHLDFSSPAHSSVTQDIPVHNETQQDWNMQAEVCGEGFCGPKVLNVPAGTTVCYPLSFHPTAQSVFMGKLSLQNDCDGAEHVFTLRGVGERPLPVDQVVSYYPPGKNS